ncbi:MAG: hypothetical protein V4549_07490 [Bacteroidota bacterium]
MKEIKKGDMVKLEVDGKTVYGVVISVVSESASVTFSRIGNSECREVTLPFELDKLKKIGHP